MIALVPRRLDLGRPVIGAERELHVLGDVDQHRPRPPALRDVERLVQHARQVRDVLDQIIVLGAAARDADRVAFLERVRADQRRRHLPRDADHRDRIHQRIGEARDRVGRARPGRHQHDADLAGRARIALGHVRRALLVPHQDVPHLVLLEDRVVHRQHRAAGIAENIGHALIHQRLDHHLRARHLLGHLFVSSFAALAAEFQAIKKAPFGTLVRRTDPRGDLPHVSDAPGSYENAPHLRLLLNPRHNSPGRAGRQPAPPGACCCSCLA